MKFRILIMPLATVALAGAFLIISAQQSDDEVRGAFISTRPKTTNANAPARRHRPPPRNTNSSANTPRNSNRARNACRRSGGRVYAADGSEVTQADEAEYDKKVMRVRVGP